MNVDASDENSDVADVTIEVEEKPAPSDQLKKFDQSDSGGCLDVLLALFCFGFCLLVSLGTADEIFPGNRIPVFLWVLLPMISLVTSLYAVKRIRRAMNQFWNSPKGVAVSTTIRLVGGMIALVSVLIGFVIVYDEPGGRFRVSRHLVLVFCWFALGLLMRLFPRGELK